MRRQNTRVCMLTRLTEFFCLFTLLVLPWFATSATAATTHYVNANSGLNTNDGLSLATAKKTIQAAIGTAAAGDLIDVAPGLYQENVSIPISLTLQGAKAGIDPHRAGSTGPIPAARNPADPATESIIDGNSAGIPVSFGANNCVLDGFTVKNGNGMGIFMPGNFGSLTIVNNIITGNVIGISANCNTPCLIQHNLFDSNNAPGSAGGAGIYTDSITQDLTIDANEFRNHTVNNPSIFAATLQRTHINLTYAHNYLHDNAYGVFSQAIDGALFAENEISTNGNSNGLTLGGGCDNILIANNKLDNNLAGVRIVDFVFFLYYPNPDFGPNGNVTIQQNSFANCTLGVRIGANPDPANYALGTAYYGNVPASENWWGNSSGPANASNPSGTGSPVSDLVTFVPWLIDGTNSTAAIGFHPNLLPSISSVSPTVAFAGSTNAIVTVTGTNFVPDVTKLTWNGAQRLTSVNSSTSASMFLPSSDTAAAATAKIQAVNTWTGGGFSNVIMYSVLPALPVIQSAATAQPNPATVGQNVTLSIAATDPASLPLAYTWDFGDGTAGTGGNVIHAYDTAGTFTATVTITNGGSSSTSSVIVIVTISGSITPPAEPLTITKQRLRAANPSTGKDTVQLTGRFMLPTGTTSLAGMLTFSVGNVSKNFTLTSSGSGRATGGTLRLRAPMKRKMITSLQATFQGTLKGDFLAELVRAGYTPGANGPIALAAQIVIRGQPYAANVTFNLKASTHGTIGK